MYQNSLFYLQQGTAYVVEQEENSIFLLSNSLAFTLRPQDLGSKAPSIKIKPQLSSSLMSVNTLTDTKSKAKTKVLFSNKAQTQTQNNLNSTSTSTLEDSQAFSLMQTKGKTKNLNPILSYKEDSNLNFKSINLELVQFKNSHYSYPLVRQSANFTGKEFYNSHLLLQLNRSSTTARIVRATKGGYLCLICGVLGFLPKTHAPRFLSLGLLTKKYGSTRKQEIKSLKSKSKFKSKLKAKSKSKSKSKFKSTTSSKKKFKALSLRIFKTLYGFSDLCERNFFLSIPCRYLSRVVYPPKTQRGYFQFNFIFTTLPVGFLIGERKKYIIKQTLSSTSIKRNDSGFSNTSSSNLKTVKSSIKSSNINTNSNSNLKNKSEVKSQQPKKFGSESKRPIKS